MKLGIVVSRTILNKEFVFFMIEEAIKTYNITHIVSGGAIGIDSIAEEYAINHRLSTIIHHAQWKKYGKSAGYRRNKLIWKDSDIIIAFWDGESEGTKHTIDNYKGKLFVITFNKENYPEYFI